MSNKTITQKQDERFYTRAQVDSATIVDTDAEKSFEVTFATETPVFRRSWEENFNEILSCLPEHIRSERLDEGAVPLLDNHDRWSGVKGQLGIVTEWSVKNKVCRAKIMFSTREELKEIWGDIKAKIIRSISCGYNVYKYIREVVSDNSIPNYTATDWEPMEISLAPVPADFRSKIRNDSQVVAHDVIIENLSPVQNVRSNMEKETEVVEKTTTNPQPEAGSRSATPVAPAVDAAQVRADAVKAERIRAASIRTRVASAKLGEEFANDLIERGVTLEEASNEIFAKLAANDTTPAVRNASVTSATIVVDEVENTRKAMSDALLHRSTPGSVKLEGKAQDYRFMSMMDMARACLIAKGEKAYGYSPNELISRAIATTDYPLLLNSTVERTIRKTYEALPVEWKQIAKQITAKDFREKTGIAYDGKITFEEIAQGGEYTESKFLENESAKIKLKTYGKKVSITRQTIINDDLDVFSKLPSLIARGAANFQADMVWGLLTNGTTKTPDNVNLFHASHGNLAGSGAAPSETTLSAARVAMWKQKTLAGEPMPIAPKHIIVPIELLTTVEKLLTGIVASTTGDVNIWAGKLSPITNPRLTNATAWYLAGDMQENEGLVYAYLEGEEGIFVDKEIDFNNDCVVTKARLDFAAAAWDHRPFYKNPGA
ncbi:prohead protease/major capsid protein fusion protein [Foetidibacter luteolus]|uniref:prohead protease/major capsid protein fusion protein n=1 Tax=Foetidibacter luteolus TaxID=2608880 RepID=UPI00129AF943|nr:prohead protease/major capsid protein fusion protein [Foetidibacter luteolus]